MIPITFGQSEDKDKLLISAREGSVRQKKYNTVTCCIFFVDAFKAMV